jgi:hypothetical protein
MPTFGGYTPSPILPGVPAPTPGRMPAPETPTPGGVDHWSLPIPRTMPPYRPQRCPVCGQVVPLGGHRLF